jgi:hypothetical protein
MLQALVMVLPSLAQLSAALICMPEMGLLTQRLLLGLVGREPQANPCATQAERHLLWVVEFQLPKIQCWAFQACKWVLLARGASTERRQQD